MSPHSAVPADLVSRLLSDACGDVSGDRVEHMTRARTGWDRAVRAGPRPGVAHRNERVYDQCHASLSARSPGPLATLLVSRVRVLAPAAERNDRAVFSLRQLRGLCAAASQFDAQRLTGDEAAHALPEWATTVNAAQTGVALAAARVEACGPPASAGASSPLDFVAKATGTASAITDATAVNPDAEEELLRAASGRWFRRPIHSTHAAPTDHREPRPRRDALPHTQNMSGGTTLTRRAFLRKFELPEKGEWAPLEAVARLARHDPGLPSFHEAEFMYMGAVTNRRKRLRIHLYKHRDTRRYLNLDDAGHAYEFRGPAPDSSDDSGGRYRAHESLIDALKQVDLWLFDHEPAFWRSFPPSDWPADREPAPPVA